MNLFSFIKSNGRVFPTEADAQKGFFDVTVKTNEGVEHVVRLSLPESLKRKVLDRFLGTMDQKDIVRAIVEPRFASDEFLNSLPPEELAHLGATALVLLLGPNQFQKTCERIGSVGALLDHLAKPDGDNLSVKL